MGEGASWQEKAELLLSHVGEEKFSSTHQSSSSWSKNQIDMRQINKRKI